jgi:hypothetical protein
MHPIFMEALAAERIKDMRIEAIASERAKLTRRIRRDRSVHADTTARPSAALRILRAAGGHSHAARRPTPQGH